MRHEVVVDNLPIQFSESDLRMLCTRYGSVLRAEIARTNMGRSMSYGFVRMATAEEATQLCIGLEQRSEFHPMLHANRCAGERAWQDREEQPI
jgi:RNA recognition motif-containing protein